MPMVNLLSKEEISRRMEAIEKDLKASTWRELKTNGKFAKNDKLSFITDDMLPYLPEENYADMRRLSMFRDQLTEDRIRTINRLHRELKICFPEYMDAFGKIDGAFALEVLKVSPIPADIIVLGTEGLKTSGTPRN